MCLCMLHHVIKTAEHLVAIRHYALERFLFGERLCCMSRG